MRTHLRCLSESQEPQILFVLVHGTWAREAAWTAAEASLPRALRVRWPDAGIYCFAWSGKNGVGARLKATDTLVDALSVLKHQFPAARVVVLAHSHGGNVAAWAATACRDIDTVVYLNTPFLRVLRARGPLIRVLNVPFGFCPPFNRLDMVVEGVRALMFPLAIAGSFLVHLAVTLDETNAPRWHLLMAFYASIASYYAWLAVPFLVASNVRRYQSRLVLITEKPRAIRRELVVGATDDEAFSGLTTANTIQRALGWISRRPVEWAAAATFMPIAEFAGPAVRLIFVPVFACMLLIAMMAYGPLQGLMAAESNLVVSASPTGECDFLGCDVKGRGLRHSLVYSDPAVVAAVVAWLEKDPANGTPLDLIGEARC